MRALAITLVLVLAGCGASTDSSPAPTVTVRQAPGECQAALNDADNLIETLRESINTLVDSTTGAADPAELEDLSARIDARTDIYVNARDKCKNAAKSG